MNCSKTIQTWIILWLYICLFTSVMLWMSVLHCSWESFIVFLSPSCCCYWFLTFMLLSLCMQFLTNTVTNFKFCFIINVNQRLKWGRNDFWDWNNFCFVWLVPLQDVQCIVYLREKVDEGARQLARAQTETEDTKLLLQHARRSLREERENNQVVMSWGHSKPGHLCQNSDWAVSPEASLEAEVGACPHLDL